MSMPDVFAFLDFRAFLRTWFEEKKRLEPTYSYTRFSSDGGCSRAALANVIGGARRPKADTLDAFARAMDLSPGEREYLGLLVDLDAAETISGRRVVMERLLAKEKFAQIRIAENHCHDDASRYLEFWWVPAIRELAALPGFQDDADWVATTLTPSITRVQAQAALDTLFNLGFLERTEDGVRQRELVFRTEDTAAAAAAAHFHRVALPELMATLDTSRVDQQHLLASITILDSTTIAEVKQILNTTIAQLTALSESTARTTNARVYQLGIQLFPVSNANTAEPTEALSDSTKASSPDSVS